METSKRVARVLYSSARFYCQRSDICISDRKANENTVNFDTLQMRATATLDLTIILLPKAKGVGSL